MINGKFENISLEDIQLLINNCVCEDKTLDYKRDLNLGTDSEKKEFLADVSSFANSIGGDLIIGIEEDKNDKIPTNIYGISYENEDTLIRNIESLIRDSIEPMILNIKYRTIELENNRCILIIRIPPSLISPHRIKFKGDSKFYARNNKGKYPMDINELRLAFNSGLDLNKRIADYKNERYYSLIENKYNILKSNSPIFVVHYIPISVFNNSMQFFSISDIKRSMNASCATIFGNLAPKNITIDGISMTHKQYSDSSLGYYKNSGIIEKATTDWFEKGFTLSNIMPPVTVNCIFCGELFNKICQDFNEIKKYYNSLGITPPIIISYAFLNATNYTIPSERAFHHVLGKIDRDILCINDLYVDNFNNSTEKILKPAFDSIWNACGYEKCPAYDDDGNYIGLY